LGHRADVFAVQVEVAQPPVFPIANHQQRLAVTHVDSQPVRTVELPLTVSFLRKREGRISRLELRTDHRGAIVQYWSHLYVRPSSPLGRGPLD
jgi:hypothetical protein